MYRKYVKRLLDIFFAIIFMPILGICCVIIGILIKKEDNGSIFYCANRLGKGGCVFQMYKFRSMKVNAPEIRRKDGSAFNSEDDDRQTKLGRLLRKTSIDEVPQLMNILKGEMSFVGPRPDLPDAANYYKEDECSKLNVLPGVTGYNQAFFRNSIEWKERLRNDVYYVNNISFILDVKIVIKTIVCVFNKRNIYANVGKD